MNIDKFKYDSNHNPELNFTRIKFGHDNGILETELNEMQILQENNLASFVKRLTPSGFIELIQKEFTGKPIIYNPIEKSIVKLNHIALAPSRAIVNGYEVTLSGNFSCDGFNNYILVNLGEPPDNNVRDDLVYLEVWFENIKGDDPVKKWGYQKGDIIDSNIIDKRINKETSRRVALKWNIRVKQNVQFDLYPNGLDYHNITNFSPIRAIANGTLGYKLDHNLVFASATNDMFKNCDFYKDNNLWVAGRQDYSFNSSSIYGKYIFAIPLFRVKRRNKTPYSIDNFNGSSLFNNTDISFDSSQGGDLKNNIRPDKLYYDYVSSDDFIDLRRTISVKEFNSEYYLNKGLKQLFTGKLNTKDTNQMRRVQFSNTKRKYNENQNIVFVSKFNKTIKPFIPEVDDPDYSLIGQQPEYVDSLYNYGILLNGKNSIEYDIYSVNNDSGSIDFYMQPLWNGSDNNSQQILSITDSNGNGVFNFEKVDQELIFSQYYDTNEASAKKTMIHLANNLLLARQIYHIRLSWLNSNDINSVFVYINGKLSAQGIYTGTSLIPSKLIIGEINDIEKGFIMEELILYRRAFEKIINEDSYIYIGNEYWPNLPKDFINKKSLLLPSFNSYVNHYGDNSYIQNNTITRLIREEPGEGETSSVFKLHMPIGRLVHEGYDINQYPVVYDLNGREIEGNWSGFGTNIGIFKVAENVEYSNIEEIIVKYSLVTSPGNGGSDLPNEILGAGLIYENDKGEKLIEEISYNRKNDVQPRRVQYIKPRRISGEIDRAYDFSLNRNNDQCFARLLYYHMAGNGTNRYYIPANLYGYEILGISNVTNRRIISCTKLFDNQDPSNNKFEVELSKEVLPGDIVEFEICLGGLTFEYETQTKTLISNIHIAKNLYLTADGINDEFVIPCFSQEYNGGILKSTFALKNNILDDQNNVIDYEKNRACYYNGSMFYKEDILDELEKPTGRYNHILYTYTVEEESFGTPFIKVKFDIRPANGTIITIPVLVSYQPTEADVISVWYNHVPYQGLLSNQKKKLKRISDWKYFITTLSSGNLSIDINQDNIYSLNNITNRLPGGLANAYLINGDEIQLSHMYDTLDNSKINKQLIFTKDVFIAQKNNKLDESFFEFDTDLVVYKNAKGFQDGNLIIEDIDFKAFLPNVNNDIRKYTGASCLVLDEDGEILLFVIGHLGDNVSSKFNEIRASYGDLFRIPGIPITIQQN